jgi:integrase
MSEHSKVHKTLKSNLRDQSSFNHLSGYFKGMRLVEIVPARISEYKSLRMSEGAKPATLSRELEVFRHSLNLAVREWEWMERTPFEKVRIERVNNRIERWLTREEEIRLLDASLSWLRDIIIFALNTGMRQAEILNLKWTEVDLFRRIVTALETKNKEKRTYPY